MGRPSLVAQARAFLRLASRFGMCSAAGRCLVARTLGVCYHVLGFAAPHGERAYGLT